MTALPTGTVTFLFTDIEGSTKLARQYPDALPALLARHHEILKQCIQAHNGYAFQIVGDSVCAAFRSASEALEAALDAQRSLKNEIWSPTPIKVRMGIHTGAAHLQDASQVLRYSGYATLALTQRIMSAGHGGQILVSQSAYDLVRDTLPENAQLVDLGEHQLKDALRADHLYQLTAPDLSTDFPPLNTAKLFNHNLPAQLTSFIGREKEIAEIKEAIEKYRLVTLTGPGGTGKTRLSIQTAQEVLEEYPDGVWFVELAPILDPQLVPRITAIAIGLRDEPQRPVIDMLCDYLCEKQMLIILDNCEHLVDACAQMADRLLHAAPKLRMLATSREALGIAGEVTYQVPSLELPDLQHFSSIESLSQYDAVKLFIDRASASLSTFTVTNDNAPALTQICHRLDGIPLAIELAAAKIRVLSVEQIAERLDDRFRLLTGGSRTALERHQTLRAAIDWSYNLLSPGEQTLFQRLSIFNGGWTLEAAESVCADRSAAGLVRSEEVLGLLGQLINKSLVIRAEIRHVSRYHMLETIRQYANEKLWTAGEEENLRQRYLAYFVDLAERAEPQLRGPEQVAWLDRLEAEHDNLRAALEWSQGPAGQAAGGIKPGLRLAGALAWWWFIIGWLGEARTWVERVLESSTIVGNAQSLAATRGFAKSLLWAGYFAWDRGDYAAARSWRKAALAAWQELNDPWYMALTYAWLGLVALAQKDMHHQHVCFAKSRRLFEQLGDRWGVAIIEISEAEAARFQGDDEGAISRNAAADALFRAVGDEYLLGLTLHNLAHLVLHRGDVTRASALFVQALTLGRKFRSYFLITYCLAGLGGVAAVRGDSRRAARLFGAVDMLFKRMGTQLQSTDQQDFERNVATARAQLDEKTFAAAWEEGKKMTLNQAVEYALEEKYD
jgi:predicted ATPase/class 3 adenylate cyclase